MIRIKGAIDDRIKEEQARQAKAQQTAARQPPPRRRPQTQDGSSARLSSRQRESSTIPIGKSPDPSDFTIGDDDSASTSRVATPQPQQENSDDVQEKQSTNAENGQEQHPATSETAPEQKEGSTEARAMLQDLPIEVKTRLRKLDKLESKYAELFKAYKAAHARVQAIEPFEAMLRETTPLTSISDPSALSEYLNQVNMKSSMVLDELKRVSGERDEYKRKSESSEADAKKLEDHVQDLRKQLGSHNTASALPTVTTTENETSEIKDETVSNTKEPASTVASPKSTSSRLPSLSLFSPRSKPKEDLPKNESEDLFSFDSEVPRLEAELREKQSQVDDLSVQITSLKGDLKVTRESTEGMAQTLENTTEELNTLRDAKDTFDAVEKRLRARIQQLEAEQTSVLANEQTEANLERLKHELEQAQSQLDEAQTRIKLLETQDEETRNRLRGAKDEIENLQKNLSEGRSTLEMLYDRVQQKDEINKDLEDSLAFAKKAEREHEQTSVDLKASEKRVQAMQGIMDNLRSQLVKAEFSITELRSEVSKSQQAPEEAQKDANAVQSTDQTQTQDTTGSNKKKNKKKKKGKVISTSNVEQEITEAPGLQKELSIGDLNGRVDQTSKGLLDELKDKLEELNVDIEAKQATIDRLSSKIKDQEALQEEIETLRDDLLHQGEEHVEARDALKSVQSERQQLQTSIDHLQKELSDAQKQTVEGARTVEAYQQNLLSLEKLETQHGETLQQLDAEKMAHEQTRKDFEESENKVSKLKTDLSTAEQLAASRFKDITDLKSVLEKAQPEIRNLKKEVLELKSAKDDLKNKSGELSRLESKHEEVKIELKNLGKRLSSQDTQIKDLKIQVEMGNKGKELAEKELEAKETELQSAEARRDGAVDMYEQNDKELARSRQENETVRGKLKDLSDQLLSHERHVSSLKEEISLKTALHSSSQSLVQSLRDQMHELNTTTRELTSRSESKEEELAEAQRMLSERTRECQTMRTLLNQSESGTETRLRDMKERMEAAIEERDRIEDESSVSSRRMTRELNEVQNKLRDHQRALKSLETEKEDLEGRNREWKRLREELEYASKAAEREAEEIRNTMKGLREALDESERQVRDVEVQKADLRRQVEETNDRIEKLSKANKNLTEEVKSLQAQTGVRRPSARPGGLDSGLQSSRTSIDSSTARSPVPSNNRLTTSSVTSLPRSDTPTGNTGSGQGAVDYVYLKNVLLQFLSQKDKGHQRQLIPVLGMLLHFDDKDQQRWNAAISAR